MNPPSEHAVRWDEVAPDTTRAPRDGEPVRTAVLSQLDIPGLRGAGRALNVELTASALQSLVDLGADVTFFDVTADEDLDLDAIRAAEAVVVLGGGDVDATLYGFMDAVPNEGGKDRRSDDREIEVILDSIERDAPLLAICRGSQLLNVALGGSLIPDVQPFALHHGARGEPLFIDEEVLIEPDSIVGRALGGRDRVTVRTGHHQAVDRPAEALRVIARAHDGVVEGTEHRTATWVTGVQWHPEEAAGDAGDRRAIFGAVLDEARRRRR